MQPDRDACASVTPKPNVVPGGVQQLRERSGPRLIKDPTEEPGMTLGRMEARDPCYGARVAARYS